MQFGSDILDFLLQIIFERQQIAFGCRFLAACGIIFFQNLIHQRRLSVHIFMQGMRLHFGLLTNYSGVLKLSGIGKGIEGDYGHINSLILKILAQSMQKNIIPGSSEINAFE